LTSLQHQQHTLKNNNIISAFINIVKSKFYRITPIVVGQIQASRLKKQLRLHCIFTLHRPSDLSSFHRLVESSRPDLPRDGQSAGGRRRWPWGYEWCGWFSLARTWLASCAALPPHNPATWTHLSCNNNMYLELCHRISVTTNNVMSNTSLLLWHKVWRLEHRDVLIIWLNNWHSEKTTITTPLDKWLLLIGLTK